MQMREAHSRETYRPNTIITVRALNSQFVADNRGDNASINREGRRAVQLYAKTSRRYLHFRILSLQEFRSLCKCRAFI